MWMNTHLVFVRYIFRCARISCFQAVTHWVTSTLFRSSVFTVFTVFTVSSQSPQSLHSLYSICSLHSLHNLHSLHSFHSPNSLYSLPTSRVSKVSTVLQALQVLVAPRCYIHPNFKYYFHLLAMAVIAGCWVNLTIDSWVGFDYIWYIWLWGRWHCHFFCIAIIETEIFLQWFFFNLVAAHVMHSEEDTGVLPLKVPLRKKLMRS